MRTYRSSYSGALTLDRCSTHTVPEQRPASVHVKTDRERQAMNPLATNDDMPV